MNGKLFTKWLTEQLIPNLSGKCAIVLDNAAYHSMHEDKSPTSATKIEQIKTWLRLHNIPFDETLGRKKLYDLSKMYRPTTPSYSIDSLIRSHGHEVLRLPPYHPDFNAIELIWSQLKDIIRQRNLTFRFYDLKRITEEAFGEIGADRWSRAVAHVEKLIGKMQASDHYSGEKPTEVVSTIHGSDTEDTDSAYECGSSTDTASEDGS